MKTVFCLLAGLWAVPLLAQSLPTPGELASRPLSSELSGPIDVGPDGFTCVCRVYRRDDNYIAFFFRVDGSRYSMSAAKWPEQPLADCEQRAHEDERCTKVEVIRDKVFDPSVLDLDPSPLKLPAPDSPDADLDGNTGYGLLKFHGPSGATLTINGRELADFPGSIRTAPIEIGKTYLYRACLQWTEDGIATHVCDEVAVTAGQTVEWFVRSPFDDPWRPREKNIVVMGQQPAKNAEQGDLTRADFAYYNLRGANFAGATLQQANFDKANLQSASFRHADLKGAKLTRADLRQADFTDADLSGADLRDVDLSKAKVDGARWQGAIITRGTALPLGVLPDWHLANRLGFETPGSEHFPPPAVGHYQLTDTWQEQLCAHYRILPFHPKKDGDFPVTLACEGTPRGKLTTLHLICNSLDEVCDVAEGGLHVDYEAREGKSVLLLVTPEKTIEARLYEPPAPPPPTPAPPPNPVPAPEPPREPVKPPAPPKPAHETPPPGVSPIPLAPNVTAVSGRTRPPEATGFYFVGEELHWYYGSF